MKKLLIIIVCMFFSTVVLAQNDVTQFLGIPVDGTKSDMIEKLKAKGFTYNAALDILEGEFNGQSVEIHVVTDNNKVYRICLFDKYKTSESQIKIRFNKLCRQFEKNGKYLQLENNQEIDESEDISYEMLVHKKEYQAVFYQVGPEGAASYFKSLEENGQFSLEDLEQQLNKIESLSNKVVWFTIEERYGKILHCNVL